MMTFSDAEATESAESVDEMPPDRETDTPKAPEAPPDPGRRRKEGPIPASPATRRLARELGVTLEAVAPSGPGGRVTAEDVQRFAAAGKTETETDIAKVPEADHGVPGGMTAGAPKLPDFSKWGPIDTLPLRSIRKATARQTALAWSQIPHVSSQDDVDVTKLEALRRRHKKSVEDQEGKLTVTVFAIKAAVAALKKHPQFNASLDMDKGEIIRKHYYHIGVATDTGEGLVVPVIRDADRKSLLEIAVELSERVRRARSRKIDLEELQGGTFTITNIGAAGGRGHFAPIINYPEAAILGMSAARMTAVVRKKPGGEVAVVPRLIMPVVLTIDHRILDGVDSAKFLDFFRNALEDPEHLMLTI
jgi:pyruvate dehydrogenase E2 component (dihydrolipoamide acetyltransferase)